MRTALKYYYYHSSGGDTPSEQASDIQVTDITDTTITLTWTRGNGDAVLILAKSGGAVDSTPVDGVTYTANSIFGVGDEIGTGNFAVYNGTGTTVTVTGLTADTAYHFRAFEYNS